MYANNLYYVHYKHLADTLASRLESTQHTYTNVSVCVCVLAYIVYDYRTIRHNNMYLCVASSTTARTWAKSVFTYDNIILQTLHCYFSPLVYLWCTYVYIFSYFLCMYKRPATNNVIKIMY